MRSSEEMALVLFRAWTKYEDGNRGGDVDEMGWDDLDEWLQQGYLAEVNALLTYLFEHGRISAYLNAKQLEAYGAEYRAYLSTKNGPRIEP